MMLNTYHCKYSVGAAFCTIFLNPKNFPLCFLAQSLNSAFFTSWQKGERTRHDDP